VRIHYSMLAVLAPVILAAQTTNPIQAFFDQMVANAGKVPPSYQDLVSIEAQMQNYSPEIIEQALPAVFKAIQNNDENVSLYAASALSAITRRPDSARLLAHWYSDIRALLDRKDPRLKATAVLAFMRQEPPPKEAVPTLIDFLNKPESMEAKPLVIFALMRIAPYPYPPEMRGAIKRFFALPMDSDTHIEALKAISNLTVEDPEIIALAMKDLDHTDPRIRRAAVQYVGNMGPVAVSKAQAKLAKIANDPNEDQEIRKQAQAALNHTEYRPPRPQGFQEYHPPMPRQ
jgi:HEAT repeat protein